MLRVLLQQEPVESAKFLTFWKMEKSYHLDSSDSGAKIRQGLPCTHRWRQRFIDMCTCNSCKSCGSQSRRQHSFPKFVCLFILFIGVFISLVVSGHLLCAGQHSRQWTHSSDGDRPLPHGAQSVVEETDNKQVSR